jgi:DNA ligase D
MPASAEQVIEIDGRSVRISSPDKVMFPTNGETKLDLANFYIAIAEPFLRAMGGRPTMLERYPDGAAGKSFFQKRVPAGAPDWLRTTDVFTPNGTLSNALVIADIAHVIWAVNLGCLGFHPWPYQWDTPEITDELRIDLDPTPGTTFDQVRESAQNVKDLFDELEIRSFVKTTGSKGLHVYVRLSPGWDSYQVRSCAVAVAREMERRHPDLMTAAWWKEERGQRIFVDFNQNAPHKTVFGPWCVRPRVGGQVSTPLFWPEVATVDPSLLTLRTVPARLAELGDPWQDMNEDPQSLLRLLAMHERDRDNGLHDAPWPPVYPKQPDEPPRVAPSRARKDPAVGPGSAD